MAEGDWLEAGEAILNAVVGDYLEQRDNPLATEMAFYHHGQPINLDAFTNTTDHLVLLVHGMATTEASWSFPDDPETSYGSLLAQQCGFAPIFLRYNSGRHISENGRDLSTLIEKLPAVEQITLIGHSMGGLVIRSACYYAEALEHQWLNSVRRAIYIGSPHLGSPLEQVGHLVNKALDAIDQPVVQLTSKVARLRSAGVKDLRHGSLLDEDWQAVDQDALPSPQPQRVGLRHGMDHYLIAGTLSDEETQLASKLFGDGLVRLDSAIDPGRRADLQEEHFRVFPGFHHNRLAHHPSVYQTILGWCGGPADQQNEVAPPSAIATDKKRLAGYQDLAQEVVDKGSTAVQEVHEALAQQPYDILEQIEPLAAPSRSVKAVHLGILRGTYGSIRFVNRLVGSALKAVTEKPKR